MYWRDVLYGVLCFPVVLVLGTIANPGFLLVAAVPSGVVAGRRAGGLADGFGLGALTGVFIFLLAAVGGTYLYIQDPPASHMPGLGLAMLYGWAMLLGFEASVAGAFAGHLAET